MSRKNERVLDWQSRVSTHMPRPPGVYDKDYGLSTNDFLRGRNSTFHSAARRPTTSHDTYTDYRPWPGPANTPFSTERRPRTPPRYESSSRPPPSPYRRSSSTTRPLSPYRPRESPRPRVRSPPRTPRYPPITTSRYTNTSNYPPPRPLSPYRSSSLQRPSEYTPRRVSAASPSYLQPEIGRYESMRVRSPSRRRLSTDLGGYPRLPRPPY